MEKEPLPEGYALEYIEHPACRTVPCTGIVLAAPASDANMYQLMAYTDMARLSPHLLKHTEDGQAKYEELGKATPYRELQVKIMMHQKTLVALARVILTTVPGAKEELAERLNVTAE